MSTATNDEERKGFTFSLARSFLTQYWPFTAYVLSYVVVGMALSVGVGYQFDMGIAVLLLFSMFLGLEGLHAIDLADADIATRLDRRVQLVSGAVMLAFGAAVGVYIASLTTWAFLVFVVFEVFLGLAYNLEWFGGLLHDFDTVSGMLNFGVSWGAVPFLAGYFVFAETFQFGIVLVSIGVLLDAARVIAMFEISKPVPYNDFGIHHDRDVESDVTLMNEVTHRGNKMAMASWVLIAAGLFVTFVA